MKERNTAGKLGFIKDSEGVYRKGNFIFRDGKIIRESSIVPEGTIEDLKDDYVTLDECIRAVLAFPASIGEMPRTTNVYIDKSGKGYKVAKKLGKNTVAVVMSNRQVMDIKPRDIPEQDDTKALELKDKEDKPQKAKAIKKFGELKEAESDIRSKAITVITNWIMENYGESEAEEPCYDMDALVDRLIELNIIK